MVSVSECFGVFRSGLEWCSEARPFWYGGGSFSEGVERWVIPDGFPAVTGGWGTGDGCWEVGTLEASLDIDIGVARVRIKVGK